MKVTKEYLKKVIKESLKEVSDFESYGEHGPTSHQHMAKLGKEVVAKIGSDLTRRLLQYVVVNSKTDANFIEHFIMEIGADY